MVEIIIEKPKYYIPESLKTSKVFVEKLFEMKNSTSKQNTQYLKIYPTLFGAYISMLKNIYRNQ